MSWNWFFQLTLRGNLPHLVRISSIHRESYLHNRHFPRFLETRMKISYFISIEHRSCKFIVSYIKVHSAKSKRTESILQESVKLDAWYNMLSLSRTFSLFASFLFLSRNIYRLTEPLITFIGFRAGFGRIRRSSLSLPINLERSIGCGFVKRPDEISQSTAEQWASMTRSCLVGSASTVPFPFF